MSPWTILGWIFVGIFVVSLTLMFIGIATMLIDSILIPYIKTMKLHLQTRNTPPEQGQRWVQDGSILLIDHITDDGRVCIKILNGGWSDSPEEWKQRVKRNRMYLIKRKKTS